jgi:hypothetical protein
MTQDVKKRIHLIYGICLSVAAIVAGICFMAGCCYIYFNGLANDVPQIYTPAIVADVFSKIAIPVYLCLALVVGGIILQLALPLEKAKIVPEKNLQLILSRLQAKTDLAQCEPALQADIAAEQKQRRLLCILCAGLLAVGSVIFLVFACNGNNWGSNSTPVMVTAMYLMIGCLAAPLALTIYAAYFNRKSTLREIELMKQASAQAPKKAEKPEPKAQKRFLMPGIQVAILVIGLALVILGVCNQGTIDILNKAVAICTECVGLG